MKEVHGFRQKIKNQINLTFHRHYIIYIMGYSNDGKCTENEQVSVLKKHIIKYCQPKDDLAWRAFAMTILYEVLSIILILNDYDYLGWTLHTLNVVRFFIQFHDMAHFSFFKSILLNKLAGSLIGVYVHFPFEAWRDGHNHHHKHFGNLDRIDLSQTILFTKKQYESWSLPKRVMARFLREPVIFFLFTAPLVWFGGLHITVAKRYGIMSKPFFQKICSTVLDFYLFPIFGIPSFKVYASIVVAQIIGTVLFHLQHSVNLPYRQRKQKWNFTQAALEGSTFLQIPFLLKPFTNGIEYHHIHHLNTNVASYVIQDCHESFKSEQKSSDQAWENFHINKVGYWLSLKSMANVMLDEEKDKLIPFSYGL